jgi:uncharacterized protein YeaO (DUF488 family)
VLKTKCVASRSARADGLLVLATRFRGRGLPVARYDVWVAALAPGERLLRHLQRDTLSWAAFARA